MSTQGSLIVKELIGKTVQTLQLTSCFAAPFPIKEVFEVRHSILPVKTVIGKKGTAYFGKVNLKAYCISDNDLNLNLVEESINFRGFAIYSEFSPPEQPTIDIKTTVQDVFVEDLDAQTIKIFMIVLVDITFTLDKELNNPDILLPSGYMSLANSDPTSHEFKIEVENSDSDPELTIHDLQIE